MDARIPESVKPLLFEYLLLMEKELPGLMVGCYLHGSLALDAFNQYSSDIDYITIVSRRCHASDVERLRSVHAVVAAKYPRWPMSGSYLQEEDLGKFKDTILSAPFYHEGVLHASGYHHDIGYVAWWVLKNRGIAVVGPEPQDFAYTVDWEKLIADMHENLNTYWRNFTRQPKRMAWLLTDFGIEWAVLGVLRQYYTFREHDITSKVGAGMYALSHLPSKWHRLIHEAIRIREHTGAPIYRTRIIRALHAHAFLTYVIALCNSM